MADEEQDQVEQMLKANGCWKAHLSLSECMSEGDTRDWRKCQVEMKMLKQCMEKVKQTKKDGTK